LLKKTGHFGKNSEEAGGTIDIKHKERGGRAFSQLFSQSCMPWGWKKNSLFFLTK